MPENEHPKPNTIESPYRISWKRIGKFVIPILLVALAVAYWFMFFYLPPKLEPTETTTPTPDFEQATGSAQTATKSASEKTANWKIYTSLNNDYSFKYPSNWTINKTSVGVTVLCGGSANTCESADNVDLFEVSKVTYKSIGEYTSKTKATFTEQSETTLFDKEAIKSNSILEGIALGQAGGSSITWFVVHNNQGYEIEYRYPKVETKNKAKIFDQSNPDIISTFKFL